ncbi:MAG: SDR family NAD(P)-dependent oxidoreductase [Leptospiraceae bacterium]|nr:SDR family NAD(P)-dependent oxidoreductase [Leptospiraceae bacterium]
MVKQPSAIVLGATSGIGRELADMLATRGYRVGITGRRGNILRDMLKSHPDRYLAQIMDVADTRDCERALHKLWNQFSEVDLVIVCAGTGDLNPNLDLGIEQEAIRTNVTGFTCVADWVFRAFEQQGHGHLVAITSIAALRGNRQAPAYNASKAYQANYLEGLQQKAMNARLNIQITDIRPGFVDTAMAKGEGKFWVMPARKVAQQIFQAIKSQKRVAYVTKRWWFIGVLMKVLPKFVYLRL